MNKKLRNAIIGTVAFIGVCACNNEDSAKTYNISSYYNDEVISADKFTAVKDILDSGIAKFQAQNGILILMDASDSTILASYATKNTAFSTKDADKDTTHVQMFPPLSIDKGLYETGSVLKTFYIAMGLESGKIRDDSKIDTSSPFIAEDIVVTDPHGSHTLLTPERILVESSNIGSAKIASEINGEYQYDFLSNLGLLAKIDADNIDSTTPLFLPEDNWIKDKKYTTTLSYGYGISETPLHIITAYSAIINGGTYHKPSFEKIDNKNGVYVISEANSELMRKYLRKNVTDGTGKKANSENYVLMGKTGTADKIGADGKYDHNYSISTFVGNFEHNGVEYAILVMLDDPKASKETFGYVTAGWNAVPVAGKIIEEIVK